MKTTDIKDDITYGKDDFYKLSQYYMEDAEIKDDIVVYEDEYSTVQYRSKKSVRQKKRRFSDWCSILNIN